MRLLLADDHELVRDTIVAFLDQQPDFTVVAVSDLPQALARVEEGFDLVLLDYDMPGMEGLTGLARMREASDAPVAILSGSADRGVAQQALDQGAVGFVPKTMGAKSLVNAIRFMAEGEVYAPVKFMTEAPADPPHPLAEILTEREMQVLDGLCRGLSNKEIAREIDLQEVTVKLHVKTACRKLDAKNRTQAALAAKAAGLF
ncbi:response regulator transcription factor [Roseobacter sp. HKCCA0434]|uniref:response regulator transcription factor n=1 Tax=Roseobacter sp. HKCCA0434 TaxID=3079297 RepID=UPI002905EC48|nr:response regulator transcription factor [Roseobacter sp. HKCCA0434]